MVVLGAATTLCGCSPVAADCLAPRDPAATDCVVIDGQDWYFGEGAQEPAYSEYCSAACIDFSGDFSVYKPNDLRTVPLLRKLRFVESLRISIDTLSDLSGLELVEANRISLSGNNVYPTKTFTSFRGLTETSTDDLRVEYAPGLTSMESLPRSGLIHFTATEIGLVDADVTQLDDLSTLFLQSSDSLRSLRLGSRRMASVSLQSNFGLTRIDWGEGLIVDRVSFFENRTLSSCRIEEFVDDVLRDGGIRGYVMSNGPCP